MALIANISLFGQIYALNERWGIDRDVIHQLLGAFYSHPGILAYEARVRDRNYDKPAGEGFGVEGGLKDVNAMIHAGEEVGVSLPFCEAIREQYASTIENGMKDMDWSAVGDAERIKAGLPHPSQQKK